MNSCDLSFIKLSVLSIQIPTHMYQLVLLMIVFVFQKTIHSSNYRSIRKELFKLPYMSAQKGTLNLLTWIEFQSQFCYRLNQAVLNEHDSIFHFIHTHNLLHFEPVYIDIIICLVWTFNVCLRIWRTNWVTFLM